MSTSLSTGRPRTKPDTVPNINRRTADLERYYNEDPLIGWAKSAYMNARRRARRKHIAFDITVEDVIKAAAGATHCPISGLPLLYGRGHGHPHPQSASIDRIDNNESYNRESIAVISNRCNALKSNCSVDELIALGEYAKLVRD